MKRNILTGFFFFMLIETFSQNVTIYVIDRDDYDFSKVTRTVTSQKEAKTNYKTMILVYDKFRKECIGGYGSYDDEIPSKQKFKEIVDNAVQDLYKRSSTNPLARDKFKPLMIYDIKSISFNDTSLCPFYEIFNYGTVNYGVYKQRGFYFALTYDNAVFSEGGTIFEVVKFEYFDTPEKKGMECLLKGLNERNGELYKGSFFENKETELFHLIIIQNDGEKRNTLEFVLTPQKSK